MTGGLMSPEQRLRALEDLEERQKRNQKRVARSVWVSIVLGVLVLGAIVALATWQLTTVRREVRSLGDEKATLAADVAKLKEQKKVAERERNEAEQQRNAATGALASLPTDQLKQAIARQFETAPRTAALLPRIYMQIIDRADTDRAEAIRKALQGAGYVVLGIEYVPQGKAPKTDLRFYHAAERGEAEKIAQVVKNAGEPAVELNYLKKFENDTNVRPNHFELWLAPRTEK